MSGIRITNSYPDIELIKKAVDVIQQGEVIVFPTTSLYGLGASALSHESVQKVFEIKERPIDKPLLILVNDINQLAKIVDSIPTSALRIMEHFWPGSVTLIFKAKPHLPENLTAGTKTIGVRIPVHPIAQLLVNTLNMPITATSANISGKEGCSNIEYLDAKIKKKVSLILDAGILASGAGSTIVDVTQDPPRMIREGKISFKQVMDILDK
ncbi:MAG: threonylcarbamoyl-AMP synthase [Desulfobacterales bacterium]|nr:threonylcarbamoyl-AMP synthase [Desulfobacterales bacterium]